MDEQEQRVYLCPNCKQPVGGAYETDEQGQRWHRLFNDCTAALQAELAAERARVIRSLELAGRILFSWDADGNGWENEPGTPIDDGTLALAKEIVDDDLTRVPPLRVPPPQA